MKIGKSFPRAILLSALSLVLCLSLFLGTTYAWFTDSAATGVNVIRSGKLDLGVYHMADDELESVESLTSLFCNVNGEAITWEPGASAQETFVVKNEGDLALKYRFSLRFFDATANSDGDTLADVLLVSATVDDGDAQTDTLSDFTHESHLLPGESCEIKIQIVWNPGDHDNAFQALRIHLGLNVVATQYTYESDSIDDQYDAGATYPADIAWVTADTVADPDWYDADAQELEIVDAADFLAFMKTAYTWGVADRVNVPDFSGKTVKLSTDLYLADGYVWTPISPYDSQWNSNGGFKGTFDGQNHTIYNMNVTGANATGRGYRLGLFGEVGNGAVFKNLTVEGMNVYAGNTSAGAICAQVSGSVTFENITVRNTTIRQGRCSGGIVGNVADGTITFRNCRVEDSAMFTIHHNSCGALYGYKYDSANVIVENCEVDNVVKHYFKDASGVQDWDTFREITLADALTRYAGEQATYGGN